MALEAQSLGGTSKQQTPPNDDQSKGGAPNDGSQPSGDQTPTRPEWVPEDHWDATTNSLKLDTFGQHYSELTAAQKAEADRVAALPKALEEYKFEIPADIELPEGMTREQVKIDEKDPIYQAFRQFAFENKLDPAAASGPVKMYIQKQINDVAAINARVKEEGAKLGADAGTARIAALDNFLTAQIGPNFAKALVGEGRVWTADQVMALEALQKKMTSQGAHTPDPKNVEGKEPPPLTLNQRLFPNSKAG